MKKNFLKLVLWIMLISIVIATVASIGMYLGNKDFRNWMDANILGKDIADSKLPFIDLEAKQNINVYTYSDYMVTLENNNLTIYNKSAKKINETIINISDPIFKSKDNYLLIADKGGTKLYLIYDNSIQWEKETEGEIAKIDINKNGMVGIILTGTAYKSVIVTYDSRGEELFKTFLSSTNATDVALSEDGEYMSFIEINTNSANIVSKVKEISVEKAKNTPNEAIINTFETESGVLLTKIKYAKKKIICLSDNGAYTFEKDKTEKIVENNNLSFIDIGLDGFIASVEEGNDGKFAVNIINANTNKSNMYEISDTVKNIYCNGEVIGIDHGNRVEFINTLGWLIKKFTSRQNIKDIIVGKNLVVIQYKDKAEILSL